MNGINVNDLVKAAASMMQPGFKFYVQQLDVDDNPTGPMIQCTVVERVADKDDWPVLVAHVGDTQDLTLLHVSTYEVDGSFAVTVNGVCGSDAQVDYGYRAEMLSDEWAGALFVVLD